MVFLPYSCNSSCYGQETNDPWAFVKLQVVERRVQPSGYDKDCECQSQRHGGFGNLNEYTAICPFSIHCTLWRMPSPHVCLFLFICVGGGSSFVTWIPQRVSIWMSSKCVCVCVCPPCGGVFLGSWLGKWNIHGGMVGLAAEQRAGWQGRAEHCAFWSSSLPLSLSLSV